MMTKDANAPARSDQSVTLAESLSLQAGAAAEFLKALAHEGRLMILCHLMTREYSVGELEALLGARQAAVSQQLARLRLEGLVTSRREGKTIFYSIQDPKVSRTIALVNDLFRDTADEL